MICINYNPKGYVRQYILYKIKATPHNSRRTPCFLLFRHSVQKSYCAIRAPELCGVALMLFRLTQGEQRILFLGLFTLSAAGTAVANHFHSAGLAFISKIRLVIILVGDFESELSAQFEFNRLALKAQT